MYFNSDTVNANCTLINQVEIRVFLSFSFPFSSYLKLTLVHFNFFFSTPKPLAALNFTFRRRRRRRINGHQPSDIASREMKSVEGKKKKKRLVATAHLVFSVQYLYPIICYLGEYSPREIYLYSFLQFLIICRRKFELRF